jgi:serine/threonine-protein kinase ULK/ATG1
MENIGNYNVYKNHELGRGSFSIVYLGQYIGETNKYITKNTQVAIKIIQTKNIIGKAINILNDEVTIMQLIKNDPHPNIVGCYDIIRLKEQLYIILEYCDSGNLFDIIRKPIKEKYAQFYFCQLANGLKYLDKHSIIHRDIKPKNILLTNKKRILKIADFGFAKKNTEQTLHETICGSPLYMAPEIMNNNSYNNQTDLWSTGMILYEMLYGIHPFINCLDINQLKNTLTNTFIEIPPNNTKNKDVSKNCILLLKSLLEKKVGDRINWNEFFEHPWVKKYDCESKVISNPNSLDEEQYIVKLSNINSLDIIDNFYEEKTKPIIINKSILRTKFSPDYIFDMEFDENLIVENIIENSSVFDENNNYIIGSYQ